MYPSTYVKRDENGELTAESIRNFAESVRQRMQQEIDARHGTSAFYKGQMPRIKGLND
jgi:hypothetical protein